MQADVQAYFDAKRAQDPWDALKGSSDPVVAYIASNVPDQYRDRAEQVLGVLPANATAQQVRDAAAQAGIGDFPEFTRFIEGAQAAGVFGATPQADKGQAERDALETWARGVAPGQVTDRHIETLMGHVDAIVAAETADDTEDE